jgi:alcohol oxidase
MNIIRSGIGGADLLSKHGIEQIVDLSGVGENYLGMSEIPQTQTRLTFT